MRINEELFKKAYEGCQATNITDFDVDSFINHCESLYKMSTKDFLIWFRKNDLEGNVEQQLWYQLTNNTDR